MADEKKRLKAAKISQYRQLNNLELQMETTPRDSRFSHTLLELMRKEETMTSESPGSQAVSQKVDEMLKQETGAFFHKVAQQNVRKLNTLRGKLAEDRRHVIAHVPAAAPSPSRPPMSDLEREAERLEQYYYTHWQSIEALHLQEAFKNQSHKIDHDWHQHESNLDKEYADKKEKLTGQKQAAHSSAADSHHGTNKWHHPEKQSTLIHTAPVIRPVTGSTARKNSGSMSAYTMTELSRLEREQEEAMKALQKQKVEAKRWLLRQQIRFTAQMDEVSKEKLVVAQILEDIIKEFSVAI